MKALNSLEAFHSPPPQNMHIKHVTRKTFNLLEEKC